MNQKKKKPAKKRAKKKIDPQNFRCHVCGAEAPQRPGSALPTGWSALAVTTTPMVTPMRTQTGIVCSFPCLLVAVHEMVQNTRAL